MNSYGFTAEDAEWFKRRALLRQYNAMPDRLGTVEDRVRRIAGREPEGVRLRLNYAEAHEVRLALTPEEMAMAMAAVSRDPLAPRDAWLMVGHFYVLISRSP